MLGRFAEIILREPRHEKSAWVYPHVQWMKFNGTILLNTKYLNDLTNEAHLTGFLASLAQTVSGNINITRQFFSLCQYVDDFSPFFRTFRLLGEKLEQSGPHAHHPGHIETLVVQLKDVSDMIIADGLAEKLIDYYLNFLFFLAKLSETSLHSIISINNSMMGMMSPQEFENTKPIFSRHVEITSTGAEFAALSSNESLEIDFLNMKCRAPTLYGFPLIIADSIDINENGMLLAQIHKNVMESEKSDTPLYRYMLGQIRDTISWYQTCFGIFEDHPNWSSIKMQARMEYLVELTGSLEGATAWWPKDQEESQNVEDVSFRAVVDYEFVVDHD